MYNRYVPQSDGSYQRNRMPDCPVRKSTIPSHPTEAPCPSVPAEESTCPPPSAAAECCPEPRRVPQRPIRTTKQNCDSSITGFLKQLIPKNFDTADLIVVLLLLLMSGDCAEDQNTALLTLALYLFL